MKKSELPLRNLRCDVYLQWAMHIQLRYLNSEEQPTMVVLARFEKPLVAEATRALRQQGGPWISPLYDGSHHATVTVSGQLEVLQEQLTRMQQLLGIACFELGTPLGTLVSNEVLPMSRSRENGPATVVGIIDDGCPFAHMHHRHTAWTRPAVRFVWDQGAPTTGAGTPPLNYGRFMRRQDLMGYISQATVNGEVVEEAAYRASGLPSLRSVTSHGAQVLSLATGWANRVMPLRSPRAPASAAPSPTPGRTDIAFVQLPPVALDDPSGQWLGHYALDGIRAIVSYGRDLFKKKASRIVVNLSYGPQTGPHDGTSILETAMDELILHAQNDAEPYTLSIVLPSGNGHLLRSHAEFDLAAGGGDVDWCIPADSHSPSYAEIWLPANADLSVVRAALVSTSGQRIPVVLGAVQQFDDDTAATLATNVCGHADRIVILMVVAPTARPPAPVSGTLPLAAPGRWKIEVVAPPSSATGVAHAYLARSDPNLGRARKGRSSWFDRPEYDPFRYRRSSVQLDDQALPGPAAVAARGSISGIATGALTDVVAGYCAATGLPATYSAGGPSRGARAGPSFAYPTDRSAVLPGVLACANRSGAVSMLLGTSFAAPQFTRDLWLRPGAAAAATAAQGVFPIPLPMPSWVTHRLGGGLRQ
jgi:hypothetical protein